MARELGGKWVGPMPVQNFLDTFTPLPTRPTNPKAKDASKWKSFFSSKKFPKPKLEVDMYTSFIKRVGQSKALGKEFKLADTSQNPDKQRSPGVNYCPDMTMYSESVDLTKNVLQYDEAQMMIEAKLPGIDPFEDDPRTTRSSQARSRAESLRVSSTTNSNVTPSVNSNVFSAEGSQNDSRPETATAFEGASQKRTRCRGQIGIYARSVMARQFRTHFFMIWLGDPFARLIRFDRTGAVVSKRFNYREEGDILLEFFWRFSNLSHEQRGEDGSVERATKEEIKIAHNALAAWKPVGYPGKPERSRPVFKLTVESGDGDISPIKNRTRKVSVDKDAQSSVTCQKTTQVLVWHPLAEPMSITGRATRGFPGWDINLKQVVFVKDFWRPVGPKMVKETEILKTLKKNEVTYISDFLCGDDLQGQFQRTLTKQYASQSWNIGGQPDGLELRQHIRFTTAKVGKRLEKAASSREFLSAIRDALLGHEQALVKCQILHRDISMGNILIDQDGCGFLNDWDLARKLSDLVSGPRSKNPRSGTWPFMSVNLIVTQGPHEQPVIHSAQDDIESALWVALYGIIRYMKFCNLHPCNIQIIVEQFFLQHVNGHNGQHLGASNKELFIWKKKVFGDTSNKPFLIPHHSPMHIFIDEFQVALGELYTHREGIEKQMTTLSQEVEDFYREKQKEFEQLKLHNYDYIKDLFKRTLESPLWPENDPPLSDMLPFNYPTGSKRKPVDDAGEESMSKRSNMGDTGSSSNTPAVEQKIPPKGPRRSSRLPLPTVSGGTQNVNSKQLGAGHVRKRSKK